MSLKGRDPLTFQEIKSWSDVCKVDLKVWEAEVLKTLDRVYWGVIENVS